MRLWTLHPRYLDPQGLVSLWREALLARAVVRGETTGYRHHPQLDRFVSQSAPRSAINAYLAGVHAESMLRGYSFDARKLGPIRSRCHIDASAGQLAYEWQHLLRKLRTRSAEHFRRWRNVESPEPHPLFRIVPGAVEPWERVAPRTYLKT
jgi:hypothetical protein